MHFEPLTAGGIAVCVCVCAPWSSVARDWPGRASEELEEDLRVSEAVRWWWSLAADSSGWSDAVGEDVMGDAG